MFNCCLHLHHDEMIRDHNNKFVFLRLSHYNYYYGEDVVLLHRKHFQKVFFIDGILEYNRNKVIYDNHLYHNEFIDIDDIIKQAKVIYPTPPIRPSSGFIGYLYAKIFYPTYEIVLVGFTGETDNGDIGYIGHDFDFEQQYYKDKGVKMIT
jgi:hypothetical protein